MKSQERGYVVGFIRSFPPTGAPRRVRMLIDQEDANKKDSSKMPSIGETQAAEIDTNEAQRISQKTRTSTRLDSTIEFHQEYDVT